MAEELNAKTVRDWGERFSNWGRWGDDDQLGTLNFITRERVIAACAIRNSLAVLHRDRDFDGIAEVSGLDSRAVE